MMMNTSKEAFMTRTGSFATRGNRRGVTLFSGAFEESLTPEQEREALVARFKQVKATLEQMDKKHPARKKLGALQHQLGQQINALRPSDKCPGMSALLVEVSRNKLNRVQFRKLWRETEQRHRDGNADKPIESYFYDVLRDYLIPFELERYMRQARQLKAIQEVPETAEERTWSVAV